MNCPHCKQNSLVEVITKNGVLVDICNKCKGIWLDKGEIYYFTETPAYLEHILKDALRNPEPSKRLNPRTQTPLQILKLFDCGIEIDYCPKTEGIWLDNGELERLPATEKLKLKIDVDNAAYNQEKVKRPEIKLPNLGLVSTMTLFSIYALLAFVLITLVNFNIFSPILGFLIYIIIAAVQFGLSPFFMDISLRWFYKVHWASYDELPSHLSSFLTNISKDNNIKAPRVGIIPDGSPNAFTYGHIPNNARIVITSGIIDLLEPDELESVVAHEVGHAVHWDMLVMTIAYLVPLLLYYIYRTLIYMKTQKNDKSAPYRAVIAIGAYVLYIVSQYIVLWFSRVREYFADKFAGDVIKEPNSLASALVKIGYGLAGRDKNKNDDRSAQLESIKAMGIFDPVAARSLAIASTNAQSMGGKIDKENLKGAMRWDMWNPWAMYYELHSTHPLIAKRLIALSRQSEAKGKEPYIRFDERRPESYWDEFFIDLLIRILPSAAFIVLISYIVINFLSNMMYVNLLSMKLLFLFFGAAYLIKIFFSYNFSFFPNMNISSLLKKVKVSAVRPVPCALKGKIIGRGVPGLIWSEDFVLQDESGIIFLDFRQPLAIWNLLFGLLRAGKYIGQEVTIEGWYRRAPVPYIELKSIETEHSRTTCYVFNVKVIFGIGLVVLGLILLFV